mmetsp:Transcript_90581/g.196077  ORF Transcript_90581/g.196077 Transcript_90581/m.196077 type:complete len:240 (+) Transcript_90581:237-956(+)
MHIQLTELVDEWVVPNIFVGPDFGEVILLLVVFELLLHVQVVTAVQNELLNEGALQSEHLELLFVFLGEQGDFSDPIVGGQEGTAQAGFAVNQADFVLAHGQKVVAGCDLGDLDDLVLLRVNVKRLLLHHTCGADLVGDDHVLMAVDVYKCALKFLGPLVLVHGEEFHIGFESDALADHLVAVEVKVPEVVLLHRLDPEVFVGKQVVVFEGKVELLLQVHFELVEVDAAAFGLLLARDS